jgi:hypothetical protein
MNRIFNLFFLFALLMVIYAHSCAEEGSYTEERAITILSDSISSEFEKGNLSESSFNAFEITAKLKLHDFVDYYNTLADTNINSTFRIKAGDLIRDIFVGDSVGIQLSGCEISGKGQSVTVDKLITNCLLNQKPFDRLKIDSIRQGRLFEKVSDKKYFSTLKFIQIEQCSQISVNQNIAIRKEVEIYVLKELKLFGSDTLNIWTVHLGRISLTKE